MAPALQLVCDRSVLRGGVDACVLSLSHAGDCRPGIGLCEVSEARSVRTRVAPDIFDLRCLRRPRHVSQDGVLVCDEHAIEARDLVAASLAAARLPGEIRTCQRCGPVPRTKLYSDLCPRCGLLAGVPPGSLLAHRARWPIGGRWQRIGRHSHDRSRSLWMRVLGLGTQVELCAGRAGEGAIARVDSTHPRFDALFSVLHWAQLAAGRENRDPYADAHAAESEPRWTRARQARLDAGYSVDLLARLARLDAGRIHRIESRLQRPSEDELMAIAAILGVHAGWLASDRGLLASPPPAPAKEASDAWPIACPRCGAGTRDLGCCGECGLPRAPGRPHRAGPIGGLGVAALIGAPAPISSQIPSQICPRPPGSGWARIGRLDASRTESLWVRVDWGGDGALDLCAGPLGRATARVERADPGFGDLMRAIDLAIDAADCEDSDGGALLREADWGRSRLRRARLAAGLSIDRLAHFSGMDPRAIARMDDRRDPISARAAIGIGPIVDADPAWLADGPTRVSP